MVPVDQVTEFYDTVVQDYLEAHAQDKGFQDNQDDISSFLTYNEKTWLGVIAGTVLGMIQLFNVHPTLL